MGTALGHSDSRTQLVITACVADVAASWPAATSEGGGEPERQGSAKSWTTQSLVAMVEAAVGQCLQRSFLTSLDAGESRYACKRRSSTWMCRSIDRLLGDSRLSGARKRAAIGLASCLAYSYFSNDERINPFQLKTNIEQHTPAIIGDQFGFTGPQFLIKEGDNADLTALDYLVTSFDAFSGPMILCAVAEPHDLLTSVELIAEQKRIQRCLGENVTSGAVASYREGVASLLLERATTATERGCEPAFAVNATYGCMRQPNYRDPIALRESIKACMQRLRATGATSPKVVFGCFRNNRYLVQAEAEAIHEVFPEAVVVNTAAELGNCSVVSGLADICSAAKLAAACKQGGAPRVACASGEQRAVELESGDGVVIQKISKLGQYAGVWLNVW